MISMSEQHDSYSLLNPELHIEYLDRMAFATIEGFDDVKKAYSDSFDEYKKAKSQLDSAHIDENE